MRNWLLSMGLAALLSLTAASQTGAISAAEPAQVGVFQTTCAQGLGPGDIVQVSRGDQPLGEATVLRMAPGGAVISLRGVYEAHRGDRVTFLRHPRPVVETGPPRASNEYRLAERMVGQVLEKFPRSSDARTEQRLNAIGQKLGEASGRNIPWNFYLVRADEPNAFTIGEGWVFVTESLLALGLTDDELAGVLAHEICHGTERHALRGADQQRQVELAVEEIAEAQKLADRYKAEYLEERGDPAAEDRYRSKMIAVQRRLDSARARLKSVGYQLEHQQEYSYAKETDADLKGLELAARAGFDPDGLDRALGKLEQYGIQRFGDAALKGGQTHPPVEKRRALLRKVQASWRQP